MLLQGSIFQFTSDSPLDSFNLRLTRANSSLAGPPTLYPHSPLPWPRTPWVAKKRWSSSRIPRIRSEKESESILTRSACQHQMPFSISASLFSAHCCRAKGTYGNDIWRGGVLPFQVNSCEKGHHGNHHLNLGVFKTSTQHLKSIVCLWEIPLVFQKPLGKWEQGIRGVD